MAMTSNNRVYQDFEPSSELVSEQDCDTILVRLPGFKKEQLRVQLTTSRILKVSGERPIGDKKWKRFLKEFSVPSNSNTKEITAKLEGGILYIRQPKLPTTTKAPTPPPPKSTAEPPTPPRQTSPPPLPQPPKAEKAENRIAGKEKQVAEVANKVDEKPNKLSTVERGVFTDLRNPANLKKLAVCVIMAIIVGGLASYFFNSFTNEEQQNLMHYDVEL